MQAELPGEIEVEARLAGEVVDSELVEKPVGVRILRRIKLDAAERAEYRPRGRRSQRAHRHARLTHKGVKHLGRIPRTRLRTMHRKTPIPHQLANLHQRADR